MNGKIFIYSGGSFKSNKRIDTLLLFGLTSPKILYIPTSINDSISFFKNYKKNIKELNKNTSVHYYPLENYSEKSFDSIIETYDIIYFSGGNTFDLLFNLRKCKNITKKLNKFLLNNKIIAGESAGAICLSPTINMSKIPINTADINNIKHKLIKGLNLFSFEVSPHFNKKYLYEINQYKNTINSNIYGLYDGSGIILDMNTNKIQLIGKVLQI
jgi:peptidase E